MSFFSAWRSEVASLYKDTDPQKCAEEIMSIGESVTPQQLVDKARDESTELHKCFTWDDGKAAEKWRLHEARQVFVNLVIKHMDGDKNPSQPEVRVYQHVEGYQGYRPTVQILNRVDEYLALRRQAYCDAQAFQRKYEFLSNLPEMQKLLDAIKAMAA